MIELNRRAWIHEFFFTIFMIFWIFEDSDGSAGRETPKRGPSQLALIL